MHKHLHSCISCLLFQALVSTSLRCPTCLICLAWSPIMSASSLDMMRGTADGRAGGCAGGGEVRAGDRACGRHGHARSPAAAVSR